MTLHSINFSPVLELYQMRWGTGGMVAPIQKFVWLGCLDVEGSEPSDDVCMERWG